MSTDQSEERVRGIITVSQSADRALLAQALREAGAAIKSDLWPTSFMTVDCPRGRIECVRRIKGVQRFEEAKTVIL